MLLIQDKYFVFAGVHYCYQSSYRLRFIAHQNIWLMWEGNSGAVKGWESCWTIEKSITRIASWTWTPKLIIALRPFEQWPSYISKEHINYVLLVLWWTNWAGVLPHNCIGDNFQHCILFLINQCKMYISVVIYLPWHLEVTLIMCYVTCFKRCSVLSKCYTLHIRKWDGTDKCYTLQKNIILDISLCSHFVIVESITKQWLYTIY